MRRVEQLRAARGAEISWRQSRGQRQHLNIWNNSGKTSKPNKPEQAAESFNHDSHLPPLSRWRHSILDPHCHRNTYRDASKHLPQQPSALTSTGDKKQSWGAKFTSVKPFDSCQGFNISLLHIEAQILFEEMQHLGTSYLSELKDLTVCSE